ncbi:unnamed protein product [Discula destructiva]
MVPSTFSAFTSYWSVDPPLDYNDTLYAGWPRLDVNTEVEIYNGLSANRTYAHHPELYSRPNTTDVYIIHSSGLIDEESMGQQIWFSQSKDGGFSWTPSRMVLPSALLPNQTQELNFSYWCNEGIQQRAVDALAILDYDSILYAVGQTTDFWCAGSLGSGNHAAGQYARPIYYNGTIAGDPCWIHKNNWTDYVRYNETVYGYKYNMQECAHAEALRSLLTQPQVVPAWSDYVLNGDLYAADGVHSVQENTNAVWVPSVGVWQRFWRDVTPTNNSERVWVEYSKTGKDWYPVVLEAYGNEIYETNIPDAKTKQFLLAIPSNTDTEGTRIFISNPRYNADLIQQPLTIATSRGEGLEPYTGIGVLRTNASSDIAPDTRDYKNQGFSYPTATRVGNNIVVGYSENKQNIWVSVISIADLP